MIIKTTNKIEIIPGIDMKPSIFDMKHTVKHVQTMSQISSIYYGDPNLAKLIMWRNPELFNEFDIYPGLEIFIPMPLDRVKYLLQIVED